MQKVLEIGAEFDTRWFFDKMGMGEDEGARTRAPDAADVAVTDVTE